MTATTGAGTRQNLHIIGKDRERGAAPFHKRPVTHLSRKSAEESEPEVAQGEGEVLVEEVFEELAHPQVRPTAVNQQQALNEAELRDGVIGGEDGLHTFLAGDSDADMGTCHQHTVSVYTVHPGGRHDGNRWKHTSFQLKRYQRDRLSTDQ